MNSKSFRLWDSAGLSAETSLTQTNSDVSLAHYLSPEQARVQSRSKVTSYAMGSFFYEMLMLGHSYDEIVVTLLAAFSKATPIYS